MTPFPCADGEDGSPETEVEFGGARPEGDSYDWYPADVLGGGYIVGGSELYPLIS
jgi:hypothetical protein